MPSIFWQLGQACLPLLIRVARSAPFVKICIPTATGFSLTSVSCLEAVNAGGGDEDEEGGSDEGLDSEDPIWMVNNCEGWLIGGTWKARTSKNLKAFNFRESRETKRVAAT
jgi:hypothetical protein